MSDPAASLATTKALLADTRNDWSDPDNFTRTLKTPVEITLKSADGERTETLTTIRMRRRIKGKDMRVLDNFTGPVAQALGMIGRLSGLTAIEVDELDSDDLEPLMAIVQGFTPPGPPTGDSSSAL